MVLLRGEEEDSDNKFDLKNMTNKKVDSKWARQVEDKRKTLFGDKWSEEGKHIYYEIGITLKMR